IRVALASAPQRLLSDLARTRRVRLRLCRDPAEVAQPPRPTLFPYTTLFRSPRMMRARPLSPDPDSPAIPMLSPGRTLRSMGSRRSEEHTSELQSRFELVCRLLLEKKNFEHRMRRERRARRDRIDDAAVDGIH